MYCKYTKTINISKYVRDIHTYTKIYKIPTSRRLLKLARKWDRVEVKHICRMAIGCKKQIIHSTSYSLILLLLHPLLLLQGEHRMPQCSHRQRLGHLLVSTEQTPKHIIVFVGWMPAATATCAPVQNKLLSFLFLCQTPVSHPFVTMVQR